MLRKQLQKVVNDYSIERCQLEHLLYSYKLQVKSLKSRLKLINRKILILNNKLDETPKEDIINFSCDDFDDLDMFV